MNNINPFPSNIRKYILGSDEDVNMDIKRFDITKFDYRKIFGKNANQIITHQDIWQKIFEIENVLDLDMDHVREHYRKRPDKWKEFFMFFCIMPFTEYEFQGKDGNLLNPDTLQRIGLSHATDNSLIGTFSDIEFETSNKKISEDRLAANLQNILATNIYSNTFNEDQRKIFIIKLLGICFKQDYKLVQNIESSAESTYKNNFMNYLFRPICEYVASILRLRSQVEEENAIGHTGVHTRVPHQSNDLFYSYPDMVVYTEKLHSQSLALVEVKKLPILKGKKMLEFTEVKMKRFLKQLIAEMFSNHTNKGMLTDSYTTILIEMDIERTLKIIKQNFEWTNGKLIALNYKVLDCQSQGLTLRGGIISFIYEAFHVSELQLNEVKRGLDTIYKFIRKTDEEYLTFLDEFASKHKVPFMERCINSIENHPEPERRQPLFVTEIELESFKDIDVQSGFTFNSQLFKVNTKDIKGFLNGATNKDDQFIVKVFDSVKAKRDHKNYPDKQTDIFEACCRAYLCEKLAYEILSKSFLFNSIYVDQKCVFGTFNIGRHYHALGPFLILKYIEQENKTCGKIFKDKGTYEKAEKQLEIIHSMGIIHGDICERNILYSRKKIYFIDFGYSDYVHGKKGSRPVSANSKRRKSEHRELCRVFNQLIPEKYDESNE